MKEISWTTCLRLGVTAAAVWLLCAGRETLARMADALMPLLLGGGFACIVSIPMDAIERRLFPGGGRLARAISMLLALAGVLAAGAWLLMVILPEVLACALLLTARLPELLQGGLARLMRLPVGGAPGWRGIVEQGAQLALEGVLTWLPRAADVLTDMAAGAMNALLALIFALYLLLGRERIAAQLAALSRRMLGEAAQRRLLAISRALRMSLRTYVAGQCLEALLVGCLCLIGMLLLRLPGALPISAMAGVMTLLPLVGPPAAAGAGALLLLPEGVGAALTFAAFFLILQQVESAIIGPHIVGANLSLSPVWTLAAMVAGGGLFGIPGAVLAVPVAAAVKMLLSDCLPD